MLFSAFALGDIVKGARNSNDGVVISQHLAGINFNLCHTTVFSQEAKLVAAVCCLTLTTSERLKLFLMELTIIRMNEIQKAFAEAFIYGVPSNFCPGRIEKLQSSCCIGLKN